jgi:phage tail sheath protein FI
MSLNIGVNVLEVDGLAAPTIAGAATSVAAFLGLTERGLPNQPVRVTSLAQFESRFGGYRSDGYLAYALQGFFLNGGREAYVSRVIGANSVPATTTLSNRQTPTAGAALRVAAALLGNADPGPWGARIRLDVRDDPRGKTTLKADTAANATSAGVLSLAGIDVGSVVSLVDGANTFYRKVKATDPIAGTFSWDAASPIAPVLHAASAQVTTTEFALSVQYPAPPTGALTVVEQWPHLSLESDSPDYAVTRINHPITGSHYIMVTDLSGTAPLGVKNPAVASSLKLTGAVENLPVGSDYAGDAGARTGLYAFDTVQVQLLTVPDAHTLPSADRDLTVRAALDYCAGRGDCTMVGSAPDRGAPPNTTTRVPADYTQLESDYVAATNTYSGRLQGSKVYGALYTPWIQVADPIAAGQAPTRFIPPDGHVMGIYARTDMERGIWKAPAGNAAQVLGALTVSAVFTDRQHTDLMRNGFVNGIRPTAAVGIIVAGSRTLSTDTRWWYVNVRLLFNFVKTSLRDGLRFVRQEPHSEALRRMVRLNVVTPFLLGLWRQGAFGSDPPAQVFSVKCDAENNPPAEVNLGNFRLEVYFYPVKPVETIQIIVGQQPSGATVAEG